MRMQTRRWSDLDPRIVVLVGTETVDALAVVLILGLLVMLLIDEVGLVRLRHSRGILLLLDRDLLHYFYWKTARFQLSVNI